MAVAYIGLGSNLETPARYLRAGVAALEKLPSTRVLVCSSFYRSAPVGVTDQPDFINAACVIQSDLPAADLMHRLLAIEHEQGRVRGAEKGGPRTLDLDLLLYDSEIVASPDLTLPHPRMHQRAFVLAPLAEIAPDLVVPGFGGVQALLRLCADQRVERLKDS